MKLLILSDSHSNFDNLLKIVNKENPDEVFFAGDYAKDGEELSYVFQDIPFNIVKGNCDYMDLSTKEILIKKIKSYKIFLTHGHLHHVKRTYEKIYKEALSNSYDIVIFGHTHIPFYFQKDNIHLFNPGAVKDGNYGIIKISNENLKFIHKKL